MTACSEMHLHHKLYMIEAAGNFLLPTQQRHSATKGGFAVLPPAVTRENFSAATEDQTWCLKLSVDSELLNPFIYLWIQHNTFTRVLLYKICIMHMDRWQVW